MVYLYGRCSGENQSERRVLGQDRYIPLTQTRVLAHGSYSIIIIIMLFFQACNAATLPTGDSNILC